MLYRKATLLLLVLFFAALTARAEDDPKAAVADKAQAKDTSYLRIQRDDDDTPRTLQTSIVRFVPDDAKVPDKKRRGLAVDLISAVHIADKSYYEQLNREFANYDVLLYELVAPPGAKIPKAGQPKGNSPLSFMQRTMKDMLDLEFQLDTIDYEAKNFVHADMSPDEFAKSMKRKGESILGTFFRMMGYAMAQQNKAGGKNSDAQLLMALFDKNRAMALKRVMAEQFQDMEGALLVLEGPDGSTLITERNKVALEVLRKQIADGKKKIGIFYGGAHMPDMQQRLLDDFKLVPSTTRWLDAWDMK
jgi:hypothetical protein